MQSAKDRYGLMLVPVGVLVGHVVGYRLAHSAPAAREAALGADHGYLAVSMLLSASVALAALTWAAFEGFRGRGEDPSAWRLLRLQAFSFLALEILERVGSPDAIAAVATERAVWIGLAAQVLLAVVGARLLRTSRRLGARLATSPPNVRQVLPRPSAPPRLHHVRVPRRRLGRAPPTIPALP